MNSKILLILSLFAIHHNLLPQISPTEPFVIALATLEKFDGHYDKFKPLYKYGNVYHVNFANGITKVYLQKIDKSHFQSKEEAKKILKMIRNNRRFKDAYITNFVFNHSTFVAPKVQVKEKELVITVRLNSNDEDNIREDESSQITKPVSYSTTRYWIQIGCYQREKTNKELCQIHELNKSDIDKIRPMISGEKCTRYLLGNYDSLQDAEKKLQKIKNCEECKIVGEKWDEERKKLVIVKNI